MKKLLFPAAALVVALMAACDGTPKADMKTDVDSLSYSFGVANTDGLMPYLSQQMGVDTTDANLKEFMKGVIDGAEAGEDQKKAAYFAGIQIGQQISKQMVKGLNYQIFGEDSTQTVSLKNILAGFCAGVKKDAGIMTVAEAREFFDKGLRAANAKRMMAQYGDNKKAGEEFLAKVAKEEGVQSLGQGVYYKVLTEGTGVVPADTTRVKVNYEGRLVDGTVFDSSYERGEPANFRCNQVIAGWTLALTHMPVGSKWEVYIPQDMAYGERNAGKITPFSTLIFTIDLLGAE